MAKERDKLPEGYRLVGEISDEDIYMWQLADGSRTSTEFFPAARFADLIADAWKDYDKHNKAVLK